MNQAIKTMNITMLLWNICQLGEFIVENFNEGENCESPMENATERRFNMLHLNTGLDMRQEIASEY